MLRFAILTTLALTTSVVAGCSAPDDDADSDSAAVIGQRADTTGVDISRFKFDLETRAGKRIFQSMQFWGTTQPDAYAQPLGCARNVAHVLGLTPDVPGLDGIAKLDGSSNQRVDSLLARAKAAGATMYVMPKDKTNPGDPTPFIEKLNTIHGGRIPVGTIVTGCSRIGCTGEGGDNHAAMVGETDENGVVWLYHNNWLRPDDYDFNERVEARWGNEWQEHMVPKERLRRGIPRQWMATPWIKIERDATGTVSKVEGMLPDIDDLYPFGGGPDQDIYYMHLAIPKAIEDELGAQPSDPVAIVPSDAPPTNQQ